MTPGYLQPASEMCVFINIGQSSEAFVPEDEEIKARQKSKMLRFESENREGGVEEEKDEDSMIYARVMDERMEEEPDKPCI